MLYRRVKKKGKKKKKKEVNYCILGIKPLTWFGQAQHSIFHTTFDRLRWPHDFNFPMYVPEYHANHPGSSHLGVTMETRKASKIQYNPASFKMGIRCYRIIFGFEFFEKSIIKVKDDYTPISTLNLFEVLRYCVLYSTGSKFWVLCTLSMYAICKPIFWIWYYII